MNLDKPTALAMNLISLYAQYVEGFDDSAKDEYNKLIKSIDVADAIHMAYNTPFERHAIKMYDLIMLQIGDKRCLPEELNVKIEIDKAWVERLR